METPERKRTNRLPWTYQRWVVRARDMRDGLVYELHYATSLRAAAIVYRQVAARFAGEEVSVALFNRVPVRRK